MTAEINNLLDVLSLLRKEDVTARRYVMEKIAITLNKGKRNGVN